MAGRDGQNADAFRLTAAGQLDPSYGGNGRATLVGPSQSTIQGVVLADGRVSFAQTVAVLGSGSENFFRSASAASSALRTGASSG